MKFSKDAKLKYSKGPMIKKISTLNRKIKIEPLDVSAVDRVNNRVLISVRQNEVEHSNGLDIAAKLYTH